MGDPEKDELDDMLNDDVGDDDMVEKPTPPAKPTPAEIRAAVEPILAETAKTVQVALQLSDDEKSLLDQLLAVYRSDAVMNKMASSGKTLKEITEALKKEMDDVTAQVRAYKKLAVAPPGACLPRTRLAIRPRLSRFSAFTS